MVKNVGKGYWVYEMPSINTAYSWAINTCNAPNVGYSQNYRNQKTVNGITYYDCSSFIWYALKAGSFDVEAAYLTALGYAYSGNAITTSNERSWLTALGFVQVNIRGEWQAGDILWRAGHTEIVYTGGTGQGVTMGAHTANTTLENQVSINTSASTYSKWTSLWRYGTAPAEKTDISLEVVSAICGNWYHESNINPGIFQNLHEVDLTDDDEAGGYGLGQWTNNPNTGITRRTDLVEWLRSNGYADDDGDGQLEYFLYEDVWYSDQEAADFADLTDFLYTDITDITELTHAFCIGWEGIHDSSWNTRVEYANICYDYILEHAQDSDITDWVTGNMWLTEDEILNNAVLVYRYLSSGGGGGGEEEHPNRMPLWFALRRW